MKNFENELEMFIIENVINPSQQVNGLFIQRVS